VPICANCGQDNPDPARFCLACGTPLAPPAPPVEERKLITVLFTDIVGSTAKAENMDPEDVRARLAPYYVRLRSELESFGGTVEKFIGDAVVALFGAPVAHEDDPERAVRAALAICDAIDDLNAMDEWLDLQVRIGVNTGEALIVVGAKSSEGEGMASGDVMNTAARLQSAAPINGILVGAETYRATRDVIDYTTAEPIAAKGKSEPVEVWEVVGIRDHEAAQPSGVALVGRDDELERLHGAWLDVQGRMEPALFGVVGAPGIGKSRLLVEFGERVSEGASLHWGRCLPYGEGITYWPITEIVKSAAGILQSDDRDVTTTKLDQFIDGLPTEDADELRTIAAALSNVIGIPVTPRGTYTAGEIAQGELHWGLRRTAQLLAAQEPTVFVFEDLHWAEPTLIELLEYLTVPHNRTPLLAIWTARPEFLDTEAGFAGGLGSQRVELEVLPTEAGTELLSKLIGDSELAESDFAEALIANAGGNPLFLEETVRMLKDKGMLEAGRWEEASDGALPVPTSLQGLISSRLDRLDHDDKEVAHDASIAGAVFWAGAVAHLGAQDGLVATNPQGALEHLEHHDFIRANPISSVAGENEYAFKHILIRDVAYGQVPKGRRVLLHVRFSDWVTKFPSSADEFVEIVAWHLEQACRLSREVARSPIEPPFLAAAGALANAAKRAEQREGLREARRYYTRAIEVLGDQFPETALELRLRRGILMAELGELKQACEELIEVDQEVAEIGRDDLRAEALVALADIDQRQGRASEANERLAIADTIASGLSDLRLQVKSAFILSALRADLEGQFEPAIANLRRAVSMAEELDDLSLRVEGHLRIGFLLYNMGELDAAEEELLRCTSLARELGSHRDEARATFQLALVKYYLGEPEEGEQLALQAQEWLQRTGDTYMQVQNDHSLARFALAREDAELAEARVQNTVETALEIGGWLVIDTYRLLTEALVRQERLDDAKELVAFAARNLPEEDTFARASLLLAEASVATAAKETTAAATSYSEALRLIEELNMTLELAEARFALGRALRGFGNLSGAKTELERARAIFSKIHAKTGVELIDRELAELAEQPV
jgi:class 3 adenylate cyclase/tetratricopeptide (TPR) repeat protein